MESHQVPYFRYFGPTAIVPGFKQMVVSVRERRRGTGVGYAIPSMRDLAIPTKSNAAQCLLVQAEAANRTTAKRLHNPVWI